MTEIKFSKWYLINISCIIFILGVMTHVLLSSLDTTSKIFFSIIDITIALLWFFYPAISSNNPSFKEYVKSKIHLNKRGISPDWTNGECQANENSGVGCGKKFTRYFPIEYKKITIIVALCEEHANFLKRLGDKMEKRF